MYVIPPDITPTLKIPIESAMDVMNESIISIFCCPVFPSVNTANIPEPVNPAKIISMVARGPPTLIPNRWIQAKIFTKPEIFFVRSIFN